MKSYDIVIIGAGQAAIPLAIKLADKGWSVAIAERKHLGGSCVNFGCTPTKAVLASARVTHLARRAGEFGISVSSVRANFLEVLNRARAIVEASQKGIASELKAHGVEVLYGHARFAGREGGNSILRLEEQSLSAREVVVNTGTRTVLPPIEGLSTVAYLHAGNWLKYDQLPQHVIIAGAGPIALEMAQFYRRMGAEVTVVGSGHQVAANEDPEVAGALQGIMETEGIAFRLNSRVKAVTGDSMMVRVVADSAEKEQSITGSHLFLATGRRPNTNDLGLEAVGVRIGEKGAIQVDERLATGVPGIWIAGDARGGPMFTHTSWDDHLILESQLLGNGSRTTTGRIVPYAIFTDPELGRVGMTEKEARRLHGGQIKVASFAMKHSGKATEQGETQGFIKLIADIRDKRLLGAAFLTAEGAELVASCITLMNTGAPLTRIRDAIYIHPTLSEAMQSAVVALNL
ncbi:MAG: FAD-dependent pyridine nucleotide-disulfide oxidoreductase [Chthoniobacteraceae bacterium]|nr:FAD-dependent pyridine nucleotide-disulfide oxidoreductase [Chthoniobacteraceae bacterium]